MTPHGENAMVILGGGYRNKPECDVRGKAFREIMDILRPLDFLDRAAVREALEYNGEWCWACGHERPNPNECECEEKP